MLRKIFLLAVLLSPILAFAQRAFIEVTDIEGETPWAGHTLNTATPVWRIGLPIFLPCYFATGKGFVELKLSTNSYLYLDESTRIRIGADFINDLVSGLNVEILKGRLIFNWREEKNKQIVITTRLKSDLIAIQPQSSSGICRLVKDSDTIQILLKEGTLKVESRCQAEFLLTTGQYLIYYSSSQFEKQEMGVYPSDSLEQYHNKRLKTY